MENYEGSILELSSAGGERTVDGSSKSEVQLLKTVNTTVSNGGRIIFYNMNNFDRDFLERLANAGKGNVLFDLR